MPQCLSSWTGQERIAGMQIARHHAGGEALSVLTIDSPAPEGLLESVREAIDATLLREIDVVSD